MDAQRDRTAARAGTTATAAVASGALAAAHRRDHAHGGDQACMPHCVEVVHLGKDAAAVVCHDCRTDTGFIDVHEAEQRHRAHVSETSTAA